MSKKIEEYLLGAAGKNKGDLGLDNPYLEIGFDGDKKRLGWVKAPLFENIKITLESLSGILEGKENFVFIGMGGSINGIKPLLSLFKGSNIHTLDNLDPEALLRIVSKIKNFDKTLIIPISKSGTTRETQLLSLTLKELFTNALGEDKWPKHFLWLSDPGSFEKLDALGWEKVEKACIQFNKESDVGGRFSSPQTLIFILPLFLLLNRDLNKLEEIYNSFTALHREIRQKAYNFCEECKDKQKAYFSISIEKELNVFFSSWVIQLFQESLGSKDKDLAVKTLTNVLGAGDFIPLGLDLKVAHPTIYLMSRMYFFQVFVAFYSAQRKINFVTQEFVEKYKDQMRKLEGAHNIDDSVESGDLTRILNEVRNLLTPGYQFIEIVLYFYPGLETMELIKKSFSREFSQKIILISVGSDWNHQSYQAAFGDKDTFYVLLTLSSYNLRVPNVPEEITAKNIETLKLIAKATYLTLKNKSLLFSFEKPANL